MIGIRGVSTLSLLKLFSIGFLVGTAPFIFLLNFGMLAAPTMISDEVKRVVLFPGVLLAWPILSLGAAWVATFFASTGLRIFGRFRAIRIAVVLDDVPKA